MAVLGAVQGRIGPKLAALRLKAGVMAFAPRPGDVFVVSYPKSGTTLMQMMLYQMTTPGDMGFPHICAISPHFEYELGRGYLQCMQVPSPRIFKSHSLYKDLPRNSRYIYMVRDVRDVALSAYHHECLVSGMDQNLTGFLSRFLEGKTRFGSWFEHIESWWPHRHDSNVLFLRYEHVISDLEGTVRKVADFCGFEVREEDMPRILERCSLPFMKQHNDKFDPRLRRVSGSAPDFIRKGGRGGGAEAMNDEQRQKLARELAALESKLSPSREDPFSDLLSPKPAG